MILELKDACCELFVGDVLLIYTLVISCSTSDCSFITHMLYGNGTFVQYIFILSIAQGQLCHIGSSKLIL